jgi:DNA polymerase-3 subunit delta'
MLLREVIGQQAAKSGLIRMEQSGQLPHALLFLGREGTGGLPLALAFSQYLLCSDKKSYDACGKCPNCQKVQRLEHADVHLTFPTIPPKSGTKAKSSYFTQEFRTFVAKTPYNTTYDWLQFINAENKQGNITADECREIIEKLFLKSYEGGKKIQIIWRPEFLGKEGNILLKLIEEPPADTMLLLIAEDIEAILPTILSRTQLVRLPPIPATDIAQALSDRGLADERKAAQVGQLSGGSYTEALRLLQHLENDLLPDVRKWFNHLFTNNGPGFTKFAEDLSKTGREGQKNFLQYVVELLEQSIRTQYMPGITLSLPAEEADFARRLAGRNLPLQTISDMIKALGDTIYRIERNAHSKTQLLALSVRLQYMIHGKVLPVV